MKKIFSQFSFYFNNFLKFSAKLWLICANIIGSFILLLLVFSIFISLIIGSLFNKATTHLGKTSVGGGANKIAIIRLQGEIMIEEDQSNPLSFTPFVITPDRTSKLIEQIKADSSIKAVVLRINSPGGSVVASQEVFAKLYQLRSQLPVVAYFEEVAASGGYYLGLSAQKIVAHPASLTGSIGVIMISPKLAGLYDKLGIEIRTYQSGEFKDMGSMARDASKQEQAIFADLIADNYQMFIEDIAQARNMDLSKVKQLADGRVYSGRQAVANGLADQLGDLDTAIDLAVELAKLTDYEIIQLDQKGFWASLFNTMGKGNQQFLESLLPVNRQAGLYYLWQ